MQSKSNKPEEPKEGSVYRLIEEMGFKIIKQPGSPCIGQSGRPPIEISPLVPADVVECIRNRIEPFPFIADAEHDAMSRLANDPRMDAVWKRLNNHQNLGRLFHTVLDAARDGQRETTQKENEAQIADASHEIKILRIVAARRKKEISLLCEREIRKKDNGLLMDGEASERCRDLYFRVLSMCAEIEELEAELPFLRGAGDPLTRGHGRDSSNKGPSVNSDPRALGVGKVIAEFLNENFGSPMCGTARTLMIVVLGLDPDKAPTRSAIRRAFEKGRCAQGR